MEKKGITSDRCELNRQIKADNALLRELKELVKNLSEVVNDTAASISEKLAQLRENMIVFCYQLKRIALGKDKMSRKLDAVQPLLKQYTEVIRQIKQKSKTRRALLAEQKNTSKLNLIKQHDLFRQITTLTEEIEELRSEKENLLLDLGCADDAGVKAVQGEVTAIAASMRRLVEQEEKYSVELDEALQQYKQLHKQDGQADLQQEQQEASKNAAARLQRAFEDRYNPKLFQESQRDVARILNEMDTPQSIRAQLDRARAQERSHPAPHRRAENVR